MKMMQKSNYFFENIKDIASCEKTKSETKEIKLTLSKT